MTWATRLRHVGLDRAVRRPGKLALEPRMGRPVVAVRRDDRAVRQGPLDRGRVARPVRRDRPRGLRARAAAQRPVRVPQHRRQEDVDLQGPRRGGPRDRRGHPARAAPVPLPPAEAEPARSTSSRTGTDADPAPVRRVRPVRGGDRRQGGPGRDRARATRRTFALLAARSATPTSPPRPPRSGRPSRTSPCSLQIPNVDVRARVEAEKGSRADGAGGRDPRRARRARPGPGSRPTRRSGRSSPSATTLPVEAVAALDDDQRALPRRPGRRRASEPTAPATGEAWQDLIFAVAGEAGPAERPRLRGALRGVPRPDRTGRAPAGCWPPSIRRSCIDRLREAAAAARQVPA